jgi:hypothetical protein
VPGIGPGNEQVVFAEVSVRERQQVGLAVRVDVLLKLDWIEQFADLLNVAGNRPPGKEVSATALQIIAAIREQLDRARKGDKQSRLPVSVRRTGPQPAFHGALARMVRRRRSFGSAGRSSRSRNCSNSRSVGVGIAPASCRPRVVASTAARMPSS